MSDERSWGVDAVALGQSRERVTLDPPPQGPRRRLPRPAKRMIVLAAVVIIAPAGLIAVLRSKTGSPIHEVENPAPRVAGEQPTLLRRHDQRHDRRPDLKRLPRGRFERKGREHLKVSPPIHMRPAFEPEPEIATETETELDPIAEAAPQSDAPTNLEPEAGAASGPTSPAAEFGL